MKSLSSSVVILLLIFSILLIFATTTVFAEQTETKEKEARPLNPLCMASEKESAVDLLLIALLFPPVLCFVYFVHRFHVHWFPESLGVIVFGIVIGLILRFVIPSKLNVVTQLDPKIFFVIFLPLIIFDAGYTMDKVRTCCAGNVSLLFFLKDKILCDANVTAVMFISLFSCRVFLNT